MATFNSTKDGMGFSGFQNQDAAAEALEIWNLGYRKVRNGGTSPIYAPLSRDTVITDTEIIAFKAQGFYVEKGCTNVSGVDDKFTATNIGDYKTYALALAQAWYALDLDCFMVGNEMLNHVTAPYTNDDMYTDLVDLAEQIMAANPGMKTSYNGTANEMATWNTWITTHGALPSGFRLGFNIYGSGDTDTTNFQTQIDAILALQALGAEVYISEWALYFTWPSVNTNENTMLTNMTIRKNLIDTSGLENYFFVWKFQNTNVPTTWCDYALKYSQGIPTAPTTDWKYRKFLHALVPAYSVETGIKYKSLYLDGSAYISIPIIPNAGKFSAMFWYNRKEVSSGAKFIFGNAIPNDSYLNGFRLYHDPSSRGIVFNTNNDVGSNGFNVISAITYGAWIHIAITITPSTTGAVLRINGNKVGNLLSGFIGTPTNNIIIGARAGDLGLKAKMGIWGLVIQNGVEFTQEEIDNHINLEAVPLNASYYDFGISKTQDLSGNGNNLTVTNGVQVRDAGDGFPINSFPMNLTY